MVLLVRAYWVEFAAFCRGRKQRPKQIIPGKVWHKIYHDHFKQEFPNSPLEEDTLKKHLREQLGEIETGTADDGHTPVIQDEDIAIQLRNTDSAATRNMLRLRQGLVANASRTTPSPIPTPSTTIPPHYTAFGPTGYPFAGSSQEVPPPSNIGTSSSAGAAPMHTPIATPTHGNSGTSHLGNTSLDSQKLTKSELLNRQSEAVCAIAKNFQESAQKHIAVMETKRIKHQLLILKEAKESGLLDDDQFKQKMKDLLNF
jgi:hypothetical protein